MSTYKDLFMRYMDREGVKYTDVRENVVRVTYSGDNMKSIPVYVIFDKDGDPMVQLQCWEIMNFNNKEGEAMVACNELNAKYRWIKFYMDKDNDIIAECDAYIDAATCGEECLKLVKRVVNITDDAYPVLARAMWA